jgi:cytochrome c-type biogenesis protein CcmE
LSGASAVALCHRPQHALSLYTVKPSIRLNYIPTRLFQLELEAGGEWTRTGSLVDTGTVKGYYFIGGYRLDF